MSTLKKLLALTLALAMVLSVSVFAGNYSADTYADADKINEDCKDAVEVMYALEIMKGNTDGTFNPEGAIKRSEMAKIIYVIMNGGKDDQAANYVGNSIFTDVPATEWYNGYVNYCAMTKKVQGYDGKFDPNGTLTVAQAAKMLLTAIGYDADAYGFVGPNWEANVLSVAHEAGLLTDVATVLTGAAPRQWVAKMVMNSLGAYCYETVAAIPGNGVLGNYWVNSGNQLNNITTFGKKYMNVEIGTGYLMATTTATLSGTYAGCEFSTLGTIKGTGLTSADLGQQFSIVYKVAKDGTKTAVSVRNTGKSVVAEALVKDVDFELTYGTSANNEKNRYEFTVGDLTGKLNTTDGVVDVKVLTIKYNEAGKVAAVTATSDTAVKGMIATQGTRNDVVRAIDKDNDGDIDYVINTPVSYAYITKVGTSNKYGDYINAKWIDGSEVMMGDPANKNLYIDELFNGAEDLVRGNFVKFVWNVDDGKFDVEALYGEKGAKFETRKISLNEYTFDGVTYNVADNAFEKGVEGMLDATKLVKKTKYDIIYDGDLLVYVGTFTFALNGMDDINEQLAVLVSADMNNNGVTNVRQVELLTIDGETNWYDYDYVAAATKGMAWSTIAAKWDADADPTTWGTLVYVIETDDGIYVKPVEPTKLAIDGSQELVDEVAKLVDGDLKVTATKATFTEGTTSYRVAFENKFFAKVGDDYTVITMGDLDADTYVLVDAVALVKDNTYYNSIVGGYLIIDETAASAAKGYLNVVDFAEWEADADYKKVTALVNGAEKAVEIKVAAAGLQLDALKGVSDALKGGYGVYKFVVNEDGEYVLDYLHENFTETLTPDEDLELWYGTTGNYNSVDFSKYEYVNLQVVTKLQDADDTSNWEVIDTAVEFTDAEAVVEVIAECEALEADHNYTYNYTYQMYGAEDSTLKDIAVVIVYVDMIIN